MKQEVCYCIEIDGVLRIIGKTKESALKALVTEQWIDESIFIQSFGENWLPFLVAHSDDLERLDDVVMWEQTFY